ncbi:hypothetical protein LB506_003539 [Fusarium annulatum]|nr:hypothetical protein LB506_003539 [Fusarium annulatum]
MDEASSYSYYVHVKVMKYTRRNVLISVVVIQTHDITDPLSRSILCGKASKHVCLMHLGKPCLPTQKSSSGWSIATSDT